MMIQRSFVLVTAFLLLGLGLPAHARVLPTLADTPRFGVEFLRNLDEFDAHWGGNVGYCWRGLMLEVGYHHILATSRYKKYHLVPVRISFPIKAAERLFITRPTSPTGTSWRIIPTPWVSRVSISCGIAITFLPWS